MPAHAGRLSFFILSLACTRYTYSSSGPWLVLVFTCIAVQLLGYIFHVHVLNDVDGLRVVNRLVCNLEGIYLVLSSGTVRSRGYNNNTAS